MKHGMLGRGVLLCAIFTLASVIGTAIQAASIQAGDLAPLNQPDGVLNAGDVVVMERFVLGQLQPTQEQSLAADVAPLNQPDGQINAGDLVVLMRAVTGQVTLPSINLPSGGFAPPYLIPPNNQTRQLSLTVYGVASPQQSINLYVNGALAASLTADSLGNFQSTVSLQEGPNSFYAIGLIGSFKSEPSNLVSVFYDTALPQVDWQQVTVTDLGSGQLQLVAEPGTVAAGNTVTLISKSGGTQTVTANANGSFSATLAGSGTGEPVTITVDDGGAGHRSLVSANQAVGALSGTFLVNESGAATYTIPIEVPPGAAGMQPELSLNYNSQSGNGLLGIGWGLSGLSVISRCPKTYAQDAVYDGVSYDSNDRFCLDGQRLVNVSGSYGADGTVYRTEVESFSLITQNGVSCGGPCGFTVQTKSGQTMVYGNSDNSRRNVSTTAAALSWAVSSVTDIAGNSIQYTYYKNTAGDHRIQKITYATTGQVRQMEFVYENRPDIARGYLAGTLAVSDKRLSIIRTKVGLDVVKEHRLSYEAGAVSYASRVDAITECGFDSSGVELCIPATRFVWQEGASGFTDGASLQITNAGSLGTEDTWQGDFKGNGKAEVATKFGASSIGVYSFEINGGVADVSSQMYTVSSDWGLSQNTFASDFNGDGITDIASASGNSVYMKLAQVGGGFSSTTWSVTDGVWTDGYTWAADFNGDGLTDLASQNGWSVRMKLSTDQGFVSTSWSVMPVSQIWGPSDTTWVADFNGDGLADIASVQGVTAYMRLSTGTGFTLENWNISNNWEGVKYRWVKDFNGDGMADIATGRTSPLRVKLSNGSDFVEADWAIANIPAGYEIVQVVDYNSDGYPDLIFNDITTILNFELIAYGNGNGFGPLVNVGLSKSNLETGKSIFFGDVDGDGKLDKTAWNYGFLRMQPTSVLPESIISITPSVGSTISVIYKPLSDGYFSELCPGYPVRCGPVPMQVVSDHYVDDGVGGVAQFSYSFTGARVHLRGRGFLGFESRSIYDVQNAVTTTTDFAVNTSQTVVDSFPDRYPYAGMASSMKSTTIDVLFQVYDSMDVTEFNLKQTTAKSYFPYVRVKREVQREVDSRVLSTTTTTTDYDTSGNVMQVAAQTVGNGDTFTKTTTNLYDLLNLRLGRLTRSTVTNTTPDGVATRTSGFVYYPDGLLRKEIIEPDEPDTSPLKQVTEYEYDSFGNKTKMTVTALASDSPASGLQTRITTTKYDANGLFPLFTINALGHKESYLYDAHFGVKTRLVGPNDLPTYWEYDALGRLLREIRADGAVTTNDYAWCPSSVCPYGGTQAIGKSSGSARTVLYRDAQDREIRAETEGLQPGALIYQDTTYDQFGRIARKSRPYFAGDTPQWATFTYDQMDRIKTENRPDGGQVVYNYAPFTKTTTNYIVGGDVAQIAKTETFDAMGRLRQVVEELGVTTTFQYDPYDNLASVTDGVGNITTTQYDRRERKIRMNDPDMGQWDYRYNGFGELTFQQDNKLQQVAMAYDALGRMARRDEPEGTTTWTYDTAPHGTGKLARVNAPNGFTRTPGYDALGRVLTDVRVITGQAFQTAYTYDRFGRVTDTTYPSGFLSPATSTIHEDS
ncbi:hypothetical protein MNBD_GAMMA13-951 [hydrothermal vent metagenome]|uniref:Dockerin domain-containing protein n=1 Tax=hydrothermal vent metagenome TaxID=652676 RepID=A0A3B0ZCD5_9ZZZZ